MDFRKYNEITPPEQGTSKAIGIANNEAIKEKRNKLYTYFIKQLRIVDPTVIDVFLKQVHIHYDKSPTIEVTQEKLHRLAIILLIMNTRFPG